MPNACAYTPVALDNRAGPPYLGHILRLVDGIPQKEDFQNFRNKRDARIDDAIEGVPEESRDNESEDKIGCPAKGLLDIP